jgi:DNA-directed RNA polymerase subunit RPC12/RpoP
VEPASLNCSNCGAHLRIDGSMQMVTCTYCGTQMVVPTELWLRFHPPAPRAPPTPKVAAAPRGALLAIAIAGGVAGLLALPALLIGTSAKQSLTPSPIAPSPIASAGESCGGRKAACSKDGKFELTCASGGSMVATSTCKGPNGCRASTDGNSIHCDTTYAELGDPCDTTESSCSTDHKAELFCRAGKYEVGATCKGPDGCTLTPLGKDRGYTLSCDDHIADVGDPCFGSDRVACSSDKRSLLACTAQRFAVDRACRKGCVVEKLVGTDKVRLSCK